MAIYPLTPYIQRGYLQSENRYMATFKRGMPQMDQEAHCFLGHRDKGLGV